MTSSKTWLCSSLEKGQYFSFTVLPKKLSHIRQTNNSSPDTAQKYLDVFKMYIIPLNILIDPTGYYRNKRPLTSSVIIARSTGSTAFVY